MKRMPTIAALPLCFAVVSGAQVGVQRDGTSHYVARNQAASALGWEPKFVSGGKMLVLCRDGLCMPLSLDATNHRTVDSDLFVEASTLSAAMPVLGPQISQAVTPMDVPMNAS